MKKYIKQYMQGITEKNLKDIEDTFFNQDHDEQITIDSLDICHIFGYIDLLQDKIKNAINTINETTKIIQKQPIAEDDLWFLNRLEQIKVNLK